METINWADNLALTFWWVGKETIRYTEALEMITYMEISFKFIGHRIQVRQLPARGQFQATMMVTTCCMEAAETISFTAEEVMSISYEAGKGMEMTP